MRTGLNMPAPRRRLDMSVSTSTEGASGRNVLDMAVACSTTADAFDKLAEGEGLQPVGWPDDKPLTRGHLISQGRFFTSAEKSLEHECPRVGYQTAQDLFGGWTRSTRPCRGLAAVPSPLSACWWSWNRRRQPAPVQRAQRCPAHAYRPGHQLTCLPATPHDQRRGPRHRDLPHHRGHRSCLFYAAATPSCPTAKAVTRTVSSDHQTGFDSAWSPEAARTFSALLRPWRLFP